MDRAQLAAVIAKLLDSRAEHESLTSLVQYLNSTLYQNLESLDMKVSDLVHPEFMMEIIGLCNQDNVFLFFGKSIRHLKCVLPAENGLRMIDIFIEYKGLKKFVVTDANLPRSELLDREYSSLREIIGIYDKYIESLANYFHEIERLDKFCTVMEPTKPTFREDFRRIRLDNRTWLHVQVSREGFAQNIHLIGNTEQWHEKLQAGLLTWDHDMDIVQNIMGVFDIPDLPIQPESPDPETGFLSPEKAHPELDIIMCSICYSSDQTIGMPLPLCLSEHCMAYFHRSCLYQWLLASSGGRQSAFGVASGICPACFENTTCSEKDD